MRRTNLSTSLCLVCFLFLCVARQAPAQSSGGTVYYCASSWSNRVVYFSAPFETDELVRNNIQQAYFQFLKQKYSYPGDAPDVVCSISETLVTAKSDRTEDEDSVKRSNHSVTETTWTYRGPVPAASAAVLARAASPSASHLASSPPHTSVPAPSPVASPAPSPMGGAAAPGQHWWLCKYHILKDRSQPVLGSLMYYALFPSAAATPNQLSQNFVAYLKQNYKIAMGGPPPLPGGGCERLSDDAALRANSMDMYQKQWAASKTEAINTNWAGSPAGSAASGQAVPTAPATSSTGAPPTASSTGQHHCVSPVDHKAIPCPNN